MTEQEALALANEYQQLVFARTAIPRDMLMCPREKSFMTPCVARDGHLAVVSPPPSFDCVGCGVSVQLLIDAERQQHSS